MQNTPKGLRLHIGIFGRRNVGKSSLVNALTRQPVSIVSPTPGTTTDPVEKAMELQPLGPVLFIDTAGLDDEGALGAERIARSRRVLQRTDLALLVAESWGDFETGLLAELGEKKIPVVVVANKCDLRQNRELEKMVEAKNIRPYCSVSATTGEGLDTLRQALIAAAPESFINAPALIGDLVPPGELALLVVPIDTEAPKGRLILPQVQAIRDLLDSDTMALVVKERELAEALRRLNKPPALVVTDSQAFLKVAGDTPPGIPLTSFSILFARFKGDLGEMVRGVLAIEDLKPGDRVLIAEACTHHPVGEDIGRVKIPRWLEQYVGGKLQIDVRAGCDFPDDIDQYRLIVHCGACVANRRQILDRLAKAKAKNVPLTNYGLTIAYSLGILPRALDPFPYARELFLSLKKKR